MSIELKSGLDFLNYYLGMNKDKVMEYIKQGREEQLRRIEIKLYFRHHRRRMREEG